MHKNQTSKKALELLNSSLKPEESPDKEQLNSQILEIDPIENTPFHTMGTEENGYCLVIGKYIISESFEKKWQVIDYLVNQQWNVITNLIITMQNYIKPDIIAEATRQAKENEEIMKATPMG